ncbi:MAG TPA: hypothetical protein VFA65_24455 [Bryobacteraceae bacterium]|nr:hypothetical protein [Bryobacteraceae bacterium]
MKEAATYAFLIVSLGLILGVGLVARALMMRWIDRKWPVKH